MGATGGDEMSMTKDVRSVHASGDRLAMIGPLSTEDTTETIDLDHVVSGNLSDSGSFDLRMIDMQEFGKLFHAVPIPLFLVDKTGAIAFTNDACSKISSDHQALNGRPFTSFFVHKVARSAVRVSMAEVLHTRCAKRLKAALTVGNRVVWGRIHMRPLRMVYARYVLVLVEDLTSEKAQLLLNRKHQEALQKEITQRKRAEAAIRQSELNYRILCDNAPVGITCVNEEGQIIFANPRATEIMGLSEGEPGERLFASFLHEDDRQLLSQCTQDAGANVCNGDGKVCRIAGSEARPGWVEIKSVAIDWNGVPATLHFMQDVTNKRRLEEESLRAQKLESLGLLAGGIAHDFNNILTAILGNISLYKTSLESLDKAASNLSDAEYACKRAQGLTQQLLTFSKGGAPIKKTSSVIGVIEESSRFAFRGSNVGASIDIPGDLWPAEVDAAQISQVMQNLVINAVQAMPEGGTILVTAENLHLVQPNGLPLPRGDYVRIAVQDSGEGIPEDVLPHIFDPYFTTKSNGTGLGLATAHSIVKNHGGLITVDTKPDSGSCFSVYIPATHKEPSLSTLVDETPMPGRGKVLVMDDEEIVRELISEALTRLGYQVKTAADGKEALALYAQDKHSPNPFDAVILDLTVPGGMGGKEAALKLRNEDAKLRLVVASGYSNDPVMANYRQYGIDAVVPKPFTLAELSRALCSGNGDHDKSSSETPPNEANR